MSEPLTIRFDTRRDCETQWRAVLERASQRLDMFDPDFALFPLGSVEADARLRSFLRGGGQLRLAMHDSAHIERHSPRFLRLLRDYSHLVECRQTPRSLRQLTESFCIADGLHVLRRFHSDHARGETAFDAPDAVDLPAHRFAAIWAESRLALAPSVIGL